MNKFNKGISSLVAIIIIAVVAFVGGGAIYYYMTKIQSINEIQQQPQDKINFDLGECKTTAESSRDGCIQGLARANNNIEGCEMINTLTIKDTCYQLIATDRQDSSICEKIVENDFYTTGQPKDRCYGDIAKFTKNESLCEKVSIQEDKFGWNNRNGCYTGVAVAKGDISLCEKILQPQQKETCVRSVRFILDSNAE